MKFLQDLAERRRFGMKPGLEAIRCVCAALGNPQQSLRTIHVAGTNGKGAVVAMLDSCLRSAGFRVGRYTSPHLVRINERFFVNGAPVEDSVLERHASKVAEALSKCPRDIAEGFTFFEALTAVAFSLFAEENLDYVVLETGLGGRLDATNICVPELSVITRIGLDHCDWLGSTVAEIAGEKAGIVKSGVPVVVGANSRETREVIRSKAYEACSPFVYAPEVASSEDIPENFSLDGRFNCENAITAIAALKTLGLPACAEGLASVVWPGRFQRVGNFIVDGAHNPPAARALASSLECACAGQRWTLIAGFCGDKDVDEFLRELSPAVSRGLAVKTNNPRSLSAEDVASRMKSAGISAEPCAALDEALSKVGAEPALVCGSLFLAGEALVKLGAYPWPDAIRFDQSELLSPQ